MPRFPSSRGRSLPPGPFISGVRRPRGEQAVQCLATAALYEAGNDLQGQRAVIQVVLNWPMPVRNIRKPCAGWSIREERRTGCQFSFTCDGSLARRPEHGGWQQARRAARRALRRLCLRAGRDGDALPCRLDRSLLDAHARQDRPDPHPHLLSAASRLQAFLAGEGRARSRKRASLSGGWVARLPGGRLQAEGDDGSIAGWRRPGLQERAFPIVIGGEPLANVGQPDAGPHRCALGCGVAWPRTRYW